MAADEASAAGDLHQAHAPVGMNACLESASTVNLLGGPAAPQLLTKMTFGS
jgi:hypothetical protein